jgi:hypothetical protein
VVGSSFFFLSCYFWANRVLMTLDYSSLDDLGLFES